MKNVLFCLLLFTQYSYAQFQGDYSPRKFVHTNPNSNGSSVFNGGSSLLSITGPNNGSGSFGEVDEAVTIGADGYITFSVSTTDADSEGYDNFGYLINNSRNPLVAGNYHIQVAQGQKFSFYVSSNDNENGALVANVSMSFTGNYAPANFTMTNINSDGSASFGGAPTLLTITGTNNNSGQFGAENEKVQVPASGIISFTVALTGGDASGNYDVGYMINSTPVSTSAGNYSVSVTAGQSFTFYNNSTYNTAGAFNAVISNFSFGYPLPVKLISFSGSNTDVNVNTLNWSTASEINTRSFELQRSTDGKYFEKTGVVAAKINTVNTSSYSYIDNYYFLQDTTYFYRLKMIDQNMAFTYSPVVAISGRGTASLNIFPNPFTDKVIINVVTAVAEQAQIVLRDINGRKVLALTKNMEAGVNNIEVETGTLMAKGVYFLNYLTLNTTATLKIIKM